MTVSTIATSQANAPGGGRVPPTPDAPASAFSGPVNPAGRWRRLVAFDHCRVLLPQFTFLRRRDPVAQLHRLALTEPAQASPARRSVEIFLARIYFAAVILRQLQLFLTRYGTYVARNYGITRRRQFRDLWHCAWKHNQYPRHYYWRRLFLLADRAQWLEYFEHRQINTLLDHLNRRLPVTRATNKFLFFHHCLSHSLPTPEILAAWTDRGRLLTAIPVPFAFDLFVKPMAEYGSVGALVIPFDPVARGHRLGAGTLDWPDLLAALARHAQTTKRSLILQRRLRNSPRHALYGHADICNIRIVTAHPPADAGAPEAIGAFVRLPSRFTTTGHDRHVLVASIDLGSGRMSPGGFREITRGQFPFHPDTGAPIAGRQLPGWTDMLALALRAHRTLPWLPFVGWDIVDTDEGLKVLEANAYWGADALQLHGLAPLGRTRFPKIYLAWFDHLYRPAASRFSVQPFSSHDQSMEPACPPVDCH